MNILAVSVQGSVAIPTLWILIAGLILGGFLIAKSNKLVGFVMVLIGVILFFNTPVGANVKQALSVLLGH